MTKKGRKTLKFLPLKKLKRKKYSRISISEIIISASDGFSQAEIDMAKKKVKKQVVKRKKNPKCAIESWERSFVLTN